MVDDELYEMQCTLIIDTDILKALSFIPYKYIVLSPKRKGKDEFEYIHNGGYGKTNRCLSVPKDVLRCSGLFVSIKFCVCSSQQLYHPA